MYLAVSGCLLGENIRHNGGHKRDSFIAETLSGYVNYVSFCPEHLAFGTPRESIRLVVDKNQRFVQSNQHKQDLTQQLAIASESELEMLSDKPLCGIIFKSKSPSCGFGSALNYRTNGYAEGKGDGIFAAMCRERFALLPMEEEGRLQDAWLRENFIMQIFAYADFERFKSTHPKMQELVAFHQGYKFMLQSKNDVNYRKLGNIAANRDGLPLDEVLAVYERYFKKTIGYKSSIGKNRNVLEHMAGFLKHYLNDVEKNVLHEQIREYTQRIVPLIVPLGTIDMFAKKHHVSYLLGQKFLNPYPKELALRSDIKSGK